MLRRGYIYALCFSSQVEKWRRAVALTQCVIANSLEMTLSQIFWNFFFTFFFFLTPVSFSLPCTKHCFWIEKKPSRHWEVLSNVVHHFMLSILSSIFEIHKFKISYNNNWRQLIIPNHKDNSLNYFKTYKVQPFFRSDSYLFHFSLPYFMMVMMMHQDASSLLFLSWARLPPLFINFGKSNSLTCELWYKGWTLRILLTWGC